MNLSSFQGLCGGFSSFFIFPVLDLAELGLRMKRSGVRGERGELAFQALLVFSPVRACHGLHHSPPLPCHPQLLKFQSGLHSAGGFGFLCASYLTSHLHPQRLLSQCGDTEKMGSYRPLTPSTPLSQHSHPHTQPHQQEAHSSKS